MRKVLIEAATFRPLEREYVKNRPELRIASTIDDRVIDDLIDSAIEAYEEFTGNILCLSTWDLYVDAVEFDRIETPAPLVSATITYLDSAGASQTLATTVYKVDTTSPLVGRITRKYGQSWPTLYDESNAITVRIVAGYADANSIPRRIKDGLLAKMQEIYYGINMSGVYETCWANYRRMPI